MDRSIPWISLVNSRTTVKHLENLETYLKTDISIWVKQDNLTSQIYGDNKFQKPEFIIADAKQKKKETIATIGGIGCERKWHSYHLISNKSTNYKKVFRYQKLF